MFDVCPGLKFDSCIVNLKYINQEFILISRDGFAISKDGLDWKEYELPDVDEENCFQLSDVMFFNNNYIFCGSPMPKETHEKGGWYFPSGMFYYSSDLKNFTVSEIINPEMTIGGIRPFDQMLTNGELCIAIGNGTAISYDGVTWDGSITHIEGKDYYHVGKPFAIWNGKMFIDPYGTTSQDGLHWEYADEEYWEDHGAYRESNVAYNGKQYIINSYIDDFRSEKTGKPVGTYYYISSNGKDWEEHRLNEKDFTITRIIGTDSGFVLFGNKIVYLNTMETPTSATANPSTSKVMVDGKQVAFEAYNINNNNYFKLRDIAQAVQGTEKQFNVTWNIDIGTNGNANSKTGAVDIVSGAAYVSVGGELGVGDGKAKTAYLTSSPIYQDGKQVKMTAYNINGNNFFKLRDLGEALDFDMSWDSKQGCIVINTDTSKKQGFSLNELEKGSAYLGSLDVPLEDFTVYGFPSLSNSATIKFIDKLENVQVNVNPKTSYSSNECKVIYGDIGTEFLQGVPVLKKFKWLNKSQNMLGYEFKGISDIGAGSNGEYLTLMYIKDNKIINPYLYNSRDIMLLSWEESVNKELAEADKWCLYYKNANFMLLIDPPNLNNLETEIGFLD